MLIAWFKQFLVPGYWLWLSPAPLSKGMLIFLLAKCVGAIAAGIVLLVIAARKKESICWQKGVPRLARAFIWIGALGLLYVSFRYERVYMFSARFWLLILAVTAVVWIGTVIRYMVKVLPPEAAAFAEKARIDKYLPKR